MVTFSLVRAMPFYEVFSGAAEIVPPARIQLVATEWSDLGRMGVALKAEGVPVETLRRILGFIEEKSGPPTDASVSLR